MYRGLRSVVQWCVDHRIKVVAATVAATDLGIPVPKPAYTNTCYSLIAPHYGISVAGLYTIGPEGRIIEVGGSGGISPAEFSAEGRKREAVYGISWYKNIVSDMFS